MDRDVLAELVAEGLSIREIAARLDRSPTTVRHRLRTFGLKTRRGRQDFARSSTGRFIGRCQEHGETEFAVRGDGGHRCLRCRSQAVAARRRRLKQLMVEEAGGRCTLCGYARSVAALQFHHREPATKRFGLADRGFARSLERVREEARKCVLLCANCHAEVEAGVAKLPGAEADYPQ